MFSDVHRETMRASWAAILEAIKVSEGMPVSDLARELKMSYMGVKQHCLKLTELGFLEEWRVPREKKEVGRPEKLYRLTPKCDGLFPEAGVGLTLAVLEGVRQIYGDSAPEKLLFHHFQLLRDQWQPKVRAGKSMVEKATRLADVRDKSGWFSKCHYDSSTGFRIEEFHSPMTKIYAEYPNAARMEVQLLEQLLGTKVVRNEIATGKGRKRVVYEIATLGVQEEGARRERSPMPAPKVNDGEQGRLF
jgi:predicted ArsR family transcriptional regulator|tara:strand:+ start:3529 stop:4269 length:741 start_codon:yes stop_codon:yes gene_type:complete